MKRSKLVYLQDPPTIEDLQRQARTVRVLHILIWALGVPAAVVLLFYFLP